MRRGWRLLQKLLTKLLFLRLLPNFLRDGRRARFSSFNPQFRGQSRRLISSLPMKSKFKFKCLHCNSFHFADPRNHGRQKYCNKPDCKKASKANSQRRWNAKSENQNYFRGPENTERVRQWRKENPGYWRNKRSISGDALQETLNLQPTEPEVIAPKPSPGALQEIWFSQPALLVGLISMMTGHALQEDIAATTRSVLSRGEDILRMTPMSPFSQTYEKQTHSPPRPAAACPASI